jgi:hypothetical protein
VNEFKRPDDEVLKRFQKVLQERHFTALARESRGRDISPSGPHNRGNISLHPVSASCFEETNS